MDECFGSNAVTKLEDFCEGCDDIYLYGAGEFGELFFDVLRDICSIDVKGFIVTEVKRSSKKGVPIYDRDTFFEKIYKGSCKIILSVRDEIAREILPFIPPEAKILQLDSWEIQYLQRVYFNNFIRKNNISKELLDLINANGTYYIELVRYINNIVNKNGNSLKYFVPINLRRFDRMDISKEEIFDIKNTAIVLQGPIRYENDFTVDTMIWYRKHYPNVTIIISTWKGECRDGFIEKCEKYNISIIESEKPVNEGVMHVNYQLLSSLRGIESVMDNCEIKYVLKCRTDQRIMKPDFLIYFRDLVKHYPLTKKCKCLEERIVVGGCSRIPFDIRDFYMFGNKGDIYKLFNIPYDDNIRLQNHSRWGIIHKIRGKAETEIEGYIEKEEKGAVLDDKEKRRKERFLRSLYKIYNPEMYIYRTFYKKYIGVIDGVEHAYKKLLCNYLVVADSDVLQIYWDKYENSRYNYVGFGGYYYWLKLMDNMELGENS